MSTYDGPPDGGSRRAAGELENAVLGVLHAAGVPLSPGTVWERLHADLAYTTVVTILSRLHAKGVLERARAGRAYLYAPVADDRDSRLAGWPPCWPPSPTARPSWPGSFRACRSRTSNCSAVCSAPTTPAGTEGRRRAPGHLPAARGPAVRGRGRAPRQPPSPQIATWLLAAARLRWPR